MPKKPKKAGSAEPPAEPAEPVAQHLHDEQKRPLKAPVSGIPPNLPKQFPGKGAKHFNLNQAKSRNFRHQGR